MLKESNGAAESEWVVREVDISYFWKKYYFPRDLQVTRDMLKGMTEDVGEPQKRSVYHLAGLDLSTPDSNASN